MRIVLVDDERLARKELRALLGDFPDAEIVGEASHCAEALPLLKRTRPDLVFLDIEMPGGTGFDLLAQLTEPLPRVIFVTAYDAHALRAFEVNALDYLLKPIVPRRLAAAYRRAAGPAPTEEKSKTPPPLPSLGEDDQVLLRDEQHCVFVPVNLIRLLEGNGNHTRIVCEPREIEVYRTLVSFEERLPKSIFLRANRAQLVNRLFIRKVDPWFSGSLKATLTDGTEVEFSRRQAQLFRERMEL
ncbi:MAG: LytTR family DNA-binding domain-containing protein [Opitutaceae bacterium]|nr:LytTR family DNA-binding domain-containing protein [Opitutaceae bacterium]